MLITSSSVKTNIFSATIIPMKLVPSTIYDNLFLIYSLSLNAAVSLCQVTLFVNLLLCHALYFLKSSNKSLDVSSSTLGLVSIQIFLSNVDIPLHDILYFWVQLYFSHKLG